ncbi:unnamed protein product [marine sediment metagenome]|uniref:Uncharacterized protein n=1 Tax=marine sediment metagenome TaxID=412755 RepID=X1DN37_9ZZZZ
MEMGANQIDMVMVILLVDKMRQRKIHEIKGEKKYESKKRKTRDYA